MGIAARQETGRSCICQQPNKRCMLNVPSCTTSNSANGNGHITPHLCPLSQNFDRIKKIALSLIFFIPN